jgi:hypothetical protein
MGPATLGQGVPFARDIVVRARLPFRHDKDQTCPAVGMINVEWDACTRGQMFTDTYKDARTKTGAQNWNARKP